MNQTDKEFLSVIGSICAAFGFLILFLFGALLFPHQPTEAQSTSISIPAGQGRTIQCTNSTAKIEPKTSGSFVVTCGNAATTPTPTATPTPTPQPTATPTPTPILPPTTGGPELPREYINTSIPQTSGIVRQVFSGNNLQTVLNAAQMGDTITLEAGASFSGNFTLPAKQGSGWIIVRTSNLAGIGAEGQRTTPANAGAMAKIIGADASLSVVGTAAGASGWRLIGLEITHSIASVTFTRLVRIGAHDSTTDTASDIVIDRCYIHGGATLNTRRGVEMHGKRIAVIDSYISDIHETQTDSQAICGWNGSGPFKVVNNYLEAASENVMFGGADPAIKNLVPSDIEFRRNTLAKPSTWKGKDWNIKTLFEIKNGQRVWIDGNTFDGVWPAAQAGFAMNLKSVNQEGQCAWCHAGDLTITNNVIKNAAGGLSLLGTDPNQPGVPMSRVLIRNNSFDVSGDYWGYINHVDDLTIDRNTLTNAGSIFQAEGSPSARFVMTANSMKQGLYGIKGAGLGSGMPTLTALFPGYQFIGNVILGGDPAIYPAGNYYQSMPNVGADQSAITAAQGRP